MSQFKLNLDSMQIQWFSEDSNWIQSNLDLIRIQLGFNSDSKQIP